jgi:PIN domain nuclease of toxin-antitoxin system
VNYLVDTHYLLWSLIEPSRITKHATEILIDAQTLKYVSKISFWEIALKYSIGKLKLEGITPEEILNASRESGFKILDIGEYDIVTSHLLPYIEKHRDPFDRLIVWQCIRNDIVLLTPDIRLRGYEPHGLKVAT